ncbi:tryptophan--tRNA ligase [Candidatus Micrarchaeota archaeon]|nr:tryptophan--tRNA ligase [Candidatus Micrarchaeota archaeon]
MPDQKQFVVTPWKVEGAVDYEKLVKDFGTQLIDDRLRARITKKAGFSNPLLSRRVFYSHRDLGWLLDMYDKGEEFFLYTGRGPSGGTHLGHIIPYTFNKYLQDAYDAELWFQVTDDEKYLVKELEQEEISEFARQNIADFIACGFDPKKTHVLLDSQCIKTLYPIALKIAKRTTFSTAKAVFGFTNETNVGLPFFTALQAAPCFLPSVLHKRNIPCLIPAAIDQDPYWRIARDVAPKLGFHKPAAIHCKFISGLGKGGKMSSSEPETTIFMDDSPTVIKQKVMRSFTGGAPTEEQQRLEGGDPSICPVYSYYTYLFAKSDAELQKIFDECEEGELMCGPDKTRLAGRVAAFVSDFQKKKQKALKRVDDFLFREEDFT